jgi:transcriptional regulator with XRE-family HTH domain
MRRIARVSASFEVGFGSLLKQERRRLGLTLEALAEQVDVSAPHLSRIERGERGHLGTELRDRIASVLHLPPEAVLAADPRLPAAAERDLADPDLARVVFSQGRLLPRGRDALRRASLALIAEEFAPPGPELDIPALLGRAGITTADRTANSRDLEFEPPVGWLRPGLPEAQSRFLQLHALGHTILSRTPACSWGAPLPSEAEATAIAAFILAPKAVLGRAIRRAGARLDLDPWAAGAGEIITAVARDLVAPGWLIARRAAEEGFLSQLAGVVDL